MAYDEDLADRIRSLMLDEPDWTEKKMFGGLGFLVGGNLAVSASGSGGLMVRVGPDAMAKLVTRAHVEPFEMRGRTMNGWIRVAMEGVRTKRQLEPWVAHGVASTRSLPPQAKASGPTRVRPRRAARA